MNKYQVHFGDYYDDGHGKYATICCQSPKNSQELSEISERIVSTYPILEDWEKGLCRSYCNSTPSEEVWTLIRDIGYPLERLLNKLDDIGYSNWEEIFEDSPHPSAETIGDIWIWFMNTFGAELEIISDDWEHLSFSYGYGCL